MLGASNSKNKTHPRAVVHHQEYADHPLERQPPILRLDKPEIREHLSQLRHYAQGCGVDPQLPL